MGSIRVLIAVAMVGCLLASLTATSADSISESIRKYLSSLPLQGTLTFDTTTACSARFTVAPAGVVYPTSVEDIATVVRAVATSESDLTVAARGLGHNIRIRSQAHNGIIVEMTSLKGIKVAPVGDADSQGLPFVEAMGGEMWSDVLKASLEYGLAPRSWTDYLQLTVGGTLSNAGVSGQSFRHGPEVSNVLALEVVTGKGEVVECSPTKNSELFFAVLGGLGQFGIITKARIVLETAPQRVRWMRALYTDFATFKADQEALVKANQPFDYVEGFVVKNDGNTVNGWGAVPFVKGAISEAMIPAHAGSIMYCLEVTKSYSAADLESLDQVVEKMLAPLSFHKELLFKTDTTYAKFLDRVHEAEVEKDLPTPSCECVTVPHACGWTAPWPLLSLFIPASAIEQFDLLVLKRIASSEFNGPILVYPMNKSKWDSRLSVAVPEGSDEVFYMVSFLSNKLPEAASLSKMLEEDKSILRVTEKLGGKQYLPRHQDMNQWKRHFGSKWEKFVQNKQMFDPRTILAPGQNLFSRSNVGENHIRMLSTTM
jgi:cytokinin dehydrogenase